MNMRAVVVPQIGGPEVLTLVEKPIPEPAADQALVRLHYAGITYGDVYQRAGTYRAGPLKPGDAALPMGSEGAGIVERVGADVTDIRPGDRVVYTDQLGAYAEYAAVPAWRLVKVPEAISLQDAAAAFSQGATAHYLAFDTGRLHPGMTCLIHAAAGGVGHILLQFAKLAGARVLATVGNEAKAAFVTRLGADVVIRYRDTDFLDAVKQATGGRGVDVVYDSIGQATIARSIKATAPRGLCVLYGNASGLVEAVAPMDLAAAGSIFFTRPRLAQHMTSHAEIAGRADRIFSDMAAGRLHVSIQQTFPLAEAAQAHQLLESRTTMGKLLLKTM